MTMSWIHTVARMPPELRKAWLQHLRNFDVAHPGCHFEVAIDAHDASLAEMVEELKLDPELTFQQIIERKPEPEPAPKTFTTSVLGVGPYCVEFADGEIIATRNETRQAAIAAFVR